MLVIGSSGSDGSGYWLIIPIITRSTVIIKLEIQCDPFSFNHIQIIRPYSIIHKIINYII